MWPIETFPGLTKYLIDIAASVCRLILVDQNYGKNKDISKEHILEFMNIFNPNNSKDIRYLGDMFKIIIMPGTKPNISIETIYLCLIGFISGGMNYWDIEYVIESRQSLIDINNDWYDYSSRNNIDNMALPLAIAIYTDIIEPKLKLKGYNKRYCINTYNAIIKGIYGEINDELRYDIIKLAIAYQRSKGNKDRLAKLKSYMYSCDDNITNIVSCIHMANILLSNMDYDSLLTAEKIIRSARNIAEGLSKETFHIYERELFYLELVVKGAIQTNAEGNSLGLFLKANYPDEWEGWNFLINELSFSAIYETGKNSTQGETTVIIGDTTWAKFYEKSEKGAFWAYRSGLDSLYHKIIRVRQSTFNILAFALEKRNYALSALDDSIKLADSNSIEAISRDFFPWRTNEKFKDYLKQYLDRELDNIEFLGLIAFLNEYIRIIHRKFHEKIIELAVKGIMMGYSFSGQYDYGRPSIKLLSKMIITANKKTQEKLLKIIDNELIKCFNRNADEHSYSIPAVRYEIMKTWADAIEDLPRNVKYLKTIISRERNEETAIIMNENNIIYNNDDAIALLLTRKEANHILNNEIAKWRKKITSIIRVNWLYYSPFINKLSQKEKSKLLEEEIANYKLKEIKPPNRIPRAHDLSIRENLFVKGFNIFYSTNKKNRILWLKVLDKWLLQENRTIDDIYSGWHAILLRLVNIKMCKIIIEIDDGYLKEAVSYWSKGLWSVSRDDYGDQRIIDPSESLIRYMAATVGAVLNS